VRTLRIQIVLSAVAWLVLSPCSSALAGGRPPFDKWLDDTITGPVKAAISTRSNTNQAEAPSMSSNSSSIVDTSSASDLVGVALNLASLAAGTNSSGNGSDTTSASSTVSSYALYSAGVGENPLNPAHYCDLYSQYARQLSFTLGFDSKDTGSSTTTSSTNPIVAGVKLMVWNGRNACDPHAFDAVESALVNATKNVAEASKNIMDRFYDELKSGTKLSAGSKTELNGLLNAEVSKEGIVPKGAADPRKIAFINLLNDPNSLFFAKLLDGLGPTADEIALSEFTKVGLDPFASLDKATNEAIDDFQKAPQVSFSFLTKQRDQGDDQYEGQAIIDWGLPARRLNLTANAAYEGNDVKMGENSNGAKVAAQLQFQPFPDTLTGPKPLRFSLAFDGAWMTHVGPMYTGQLKVNLPIPRIQFLAGFEVPLSVTIANRTELVHETEVRGLIGFTLDTSQVLAALLPH
jgi:hypothetical protein